MAARSSQGRRSPPSVWPVTYEASPEQRKAIVAATSSGAPGRRSTVEPTMVLMILSPSWPSSAVARFSSGVSIGPGATALQSTP